MLTAFVRDAEPHAAGVAITVELRWHRGEGLDLQKNEADIYTVVITPMRNSLVERPTRLSKVELVAGPELEADEDLAVWVAERWRYRPSRFQVSPDATVVELVRC